MDCKNYSKNMEICNCSYGSCSRKGTCCECLHYHRQMGQLPACFFKKEDERTYDRSIEKFIRARQ